MEQKIQINDSSGSTETLALKVEPPFDPRRVANYFLKKERVSPLHLQKLLYFAHGWHLAITGHPLVNERFEAWPYGPVIPSIYFEFNEFGAQKIMRRALDRPRAFQGRREMAAVESEDKTAFRILEGVWKVLRKFTALELSSKSHVEDGPWAEIRRRDPITRYPTIPDDLIRAYFKRYYGQGRKQR